MTARAIDGAELPVAVPACSRRSTLATFKREFWLFLCGSLFFDFGFGLFFFLFNLYLGASGFHEQSIGTFASATTIGSLAGTYPAGRLAKRFGLRPLLAVCFFCAPLAGILRVFCLRPPGQWIASFLLGVAMCGWAICVPTALARLTNEDNRSLGFSLTFAVGIGSGILSGLAGGFLPGRLSAVFAQATIAGGMRCVLLLACVLVLAGAWPMMWVNIGGDGESTQISRQDARQDRRFLILFLAAFGIWSLVSGAFAPFAGLYLSRRVGLPLSEVGIVFSASQAVQVCAVLGAPLLARRLGSLRMIVIVQLAAGTLLYETSRLNSKRPAEVCFVLLNATLYMAGPSIYALLMSRVRDGSRPMASALQSITSSLATATAAAAAGMLVSSNGYSWLFIPAAIAAWCAAAFFLLLR